MAKMTKREAIHEALDALVSGGSDLIRSLQQEERINDFLDFTYAYQNWYTAAIKAVKSLASDRYVEFCGYYENDKTHSIQTCLRKTPDRSQARSHDHDQFTKKQDRIDQDRFINLFINQLAILKAIRTRVDSVLADIESELFTELEDNEVGVARQLIKISPRAAGALSGVVIEGHLRNVLNVHGIKISKTKPTISDLSNPLKEASVIDITVWRKISYLADIRNLCTHKKETEPTEEQVDELINGAEWLAKTVF